MDDFFEQDGWALVRVSGEPRVRDLDIAERAGLKNKYDIRQIIRDNRAELECHGVLEEFLAGGEKPRVGRPGKEFWLNEDQAANLILLLRTPLARELRVALSRLFVKLRALPPADFEEDWLIARQERAAVPFGYFSVVNEINPLIIWLIKGGLKIDDRSLPDISVARRFSDDWKEREHDLVYGPRTRDAVVSFDPSYRQSASGEHGMLAYPDAALPYFRRWFILVYVPEFFPEYLNHKVGKKELTRERATAMLAAIPEAFHRLPR